MDATAREDDNTDRHHKVEHGVVRRSTVAGSIFLMATAAIGPAFITQTAQFTVQLGAAFAFAIAVSILIDIAIQLNVWRILGLAGRYVQDLVNAVLPGGGHVLTGLIVFGGLVFNIGNIAGTGLGLNALVGLDPRLGAAVSAGIAIMIFLTKRAGVAIDRTVIVLGTLLLGLTVYVAIVSAPPLGEALRQTVLPENVDFLVITTIVGSTVGGYVTYAGAHRLLDAGVSGKANIGRLTSSSIWAILVTGVMRVVLFLAILGVAAGGTTLSSGDPAGSAFASAAGEIGLRLFGLALWAAGISSVIGASYTSISFLRSLSSTVARKIPLVVCTFIAVSAALFVVIQRPPVTLVIFAGALNGLILPVGVGALLWIAWRRPRMLGGYRYPRWLLLIGVLAWLFTIVVCYFSLNGLAELVVELVGG